MSGNCNQLYWAYNIAAVHLDEISSFR